VQVLVTLGHDLVQGKLKGAKRVVGRHIIDVLVIIDIVDVHLELVVLLKVVDDFDLGDP